MVTHSSALVWGPMIRCISNIIHENVEFMPAWHLEAHPPP